MGKVIAICTSPKREHRRQESRKAHLLKILVWKEMHMQKMASSDQSSFL